MAITYFQKYPLSGDDQSGAKSMRIDHPDFGDVSKTTYSKGVITDFEKIQDDPIQVKSRVKVKIEGEEESDYIPIFYHPKILYWDGPGDPPVPLATDFNAEGKYFERAWMSFRGGDEVAVMLQKGTPVAVIGFADGVPRIGENAYKFTGRTGFSTLTANQDSHNTYQYQDVDYQSEDHFQFLKMADVDSDNDNVYGETDEEKNGPDDIPLSLLKEITPEIFDEYRYNNVVVSYAAIPTGSGYCYSSISTLTPPWVNLGFSEQWNFNMVCNYIYYYGRFLIPVGAILYMVEYIQATKNTFIAWEAVPAREGGIGDVESSFEHIIDIRTSAGIYTPELYKLAKETNTKNIMDRVAAQAAYETWWEEIEGLHYQSENLISFPKADRTMAGWDGSISTMEIELIPTSIFVRPHTKEELIAAEMWPKDE